jgi:hypothetical protein
MKDSRYDLVPLHKRPDFLQQCCNLLNSEWKRSKTARYVSEKGNFARMLNIPFLDNSTYKIYFIVFLSSFHNCIVSLPLLVLSPTLLPFVSKDLFFFFAIYFYIIYV